MIETNKRIKVALMSYAMDNRRAKGTALYTRKLIENLLDDDRFEFSLVHYDKVDDPLYKRAHEIILPRLRLPYASHFISQLIFFWKYRNNKFDIIHWFQPRVYPLFWLAPARHIVITTHGAGDITAPGQWIFSREVFNFILTKFNRKVDAFIAVSKYGVKEIEQYYHAEPGRIYYTHNGGGEDFKQIEKTIARRHITERYNLNKPFILGIGRHVPHKNIAKLIEAYDIFRNKFGRTEQLVVVGKAGSETPLINDIVRQSKYKNDIIFITYIDATDFNMLYSAAQLLVFPSLQEGFGLPIIEAMASGIPVITSDISSMPEIAGDSAVLVNPNNPAEISAKMHKVLNDDELRSKLIMKGLVRAKNFIWKNTSEETKKIYLLLSAK